MGAGIIIFLSMLIFSGVLAICLVLIYFIAEWAEIRKLDSENYAELVKQHEELVKLQAEAERLKGECND